MLLYVCTQAQMSMSATANRYQFNLFDHLTSWCSGACFKGRWMEPWCRHGANKKDVWSKSDNSVILFWLLRQQVDVDQQPCSFAHLCSLTIFHHFFILTFSQYPFYPFPHIPPKPPSLCEPFLFSFSPHSRCLVSVISLS